MSVSYGVIGSIFIIGSLIVLLDVLINMKIEYRKIWRGAVREVRENGSIDPDTENSLNLWNLFKDTFYEIYSTAIIRGFCFLLIGLIIASRFF